MIGLGMEKAQTKEALTAVYGEAGMNPADYLYLYRDSVDEEDEGSLDQAAQLAKQETAQAYNKVGETAGREGDLKKAEAVMTYLGYTPEQI